jgi:hypothetical protein
LGQLANLSYAGKHFSIFDVLRALPTNLKVGMHCFPI